MLSNDFRCAAHNQIRLDYWVNYPRFNSNEKQMWNNVVYQQWPKQRKKRPRQRLGKINNKMEKNARMRDSGQRSMFTPSQQRFKWANCFTNACGHLFAHRVDFVIVLVRGAFQHRIHTLCAFVRLPVNLHELNFFCFVLSGLLNGKGHFFHRLESLSMEMYMLFVGFRRFG